jgi:uncharacterized coiled-coil protein SlyX
MKKTIFLLALFSVIVLLTSCQKGEEITVTKYFQAMQTNDKETMASMAVEPKDIEFKSFKITSSSEPAITPLALPDLEKKMQALVQSRRDQVNATLDKKDQLDEAQFELEETRRRTKKIELEKKIEELEAGVAEEEQKVKNIQAKINKLTQQIKAEKRIIAMSSGVDKNYELYVGETHTSKVIANVTLANGEVKDYVFLLRKDIMKIEDRALPGRLIVTKIATVEDFDKEQQAQMEEEQTESEEVSEEPPATTEEEDS